MWIGTGVRVEDMIHIKTHSTNFLKLFFFHFRTRNSITHPQDKNNETLNTFDYLPECDTSNPDKINT